MVVGAAWCVAWGLAWVLYCRHKMAKVRRVNVGGDVDNPLDGSVYNLDFGLEEPQQLEQAEIGAARHRTPPVMLALLLLWRRRRR